MKSKKLKNTFLIKEKTKDSWKSDKTYDKRKETEEKKG